MKRILVLALMISAFTVQDVRATGVRDTLVNDSGKKAKVEWDGSVKKVDSTFKKMGHDVKTGTRRVGDSISSKWKRGTKRADSAFTQIGGGFKTLFGSDKKRKSDKQQESDNRQAPDQEPSAFTDDHKQ